MRTIRNIFWLSIATAALVSCSTDDMGDGPDAPNYGGDIEFAIGFAPQGGAVKLTADGTPQTRVSTDDQFNSTWEDGDEIGIFAVSHGDALSATASGNYINNVKLTYSSANGGSWSGPAYWPSNASGITALDFYAYYPYDAAANNPTAITFNVETDQSGTTTVGTAEKSNYNLSDLLTAKSDNTGSGWGKNETVVLTFTHALAMVEVTLDNKVGTIDHNQDLKVTLIAMKPGASLNLGGTSGPEVTLAGTGNNPVGIKMLRMEQPGTDEYRKSFTFRALVPAQELDQHNRIATITNGDMILQSSALPSAVTMAAGKAERFTEEPPFFTHKVPVPAGGKTFSMGQNDISDAPPHNVRLTQNFQMSKYQVTNAQYAAFLNAKGVQGKQLNHPYIGNMTGGICTWNDSGNNGQPLIYEGQSGYQWGVKWNGSQWVSQSGFDNHPVIWVTWFGADEYAKWAGGALPTEAQWEYACRAETTTAYSFGDDAGDLGEHAWYGDNSSDGTKAVGQKLPNAYGLYDMHGNVFEWCADWYNSNYYNEISAANDPTGPAAGDFRVLRGGGWNYGAQFCRSASRTGYNPGYAYNSFGFRVVFVP